MWWSTPVSFVNARVLGEEGVAGWTLRVRAGLVDGIGVAPDSGDVVIDLGGSVVMPGLVNAHEHLELNAQPRLKWRERHGNVRQWIADFQPRFAHDPCLRDLGPETLTERCWVGGLKNLLAGTTTVCHHNPLHRALRERFPVRIVRRFGFGHSLQIDGPRLQQSFRQTAPDRPWIVHAAEGVDAEAQREVAALDAMGCLAGNTVLVHGVGMTPDDRRRVIEAGAGLVWCPSSNLFLFGATADVRDFDDADHLALGSDSRLSGAGDLLDELRAAHETRQVSGRSLFRSVTSGAARLLRVEGAGRLEPGLPADLVVFGNPPGEPLDALLSATRADVRLVMIDGVPLVGEPAMQPVFAASRTSVVEARLNGADRLLAAWIARRVREHRLQEPGLEIL